MSIFGRIAPALVIALTLGACSEPSDTQLLAGRVAASLDPAETCNRLASIEYLPNGTRIRLTEATLFVSGTTDLTACGEYALASVVEAMLDPRIMQVVIEPESGVGGPGSSLSLQRADTVRGLLSVAGFTPAQPPVVVQPAAVPSQGALGIVLAVAGSG